MSLYFLVKEEKGESHIFLICMKLNLVEVKAADKLYMAPLEGKESKDLFSNFIFVLLVC